MESFVDVAFSLKGKTAPLDHGYSLFGAVSRILPLIHAKKDWGLFPIHGQQTAPGVLTLVAQSLLTIRLPAACIAEVLSLSGQTLDVAGHSLSVGIPRVFPLQPRPVLRSRFVTIKKFHEAPAEFASAVRRQLDEVGVGPHVEQLSR